MSKMCSLSRAMRSSDGENYVNLLNNAKFYCRRCGRVANEKEYLCRPFPIFPEKASDIKIKEMEIAVTRDGIQKHYVLEKNEEVIMKEEEKTIENASHQCNCTPEDNCGDNCNCNDDKKIHVSELFKNDDGSYSDEWQIKDDDTFPAKEDYEGEPFIKSLHIEDKKDKKIKKLRMSELRNIIRQEIKNALENQKK